MFNTVDDEAIKRGEVTDAYFERTEEALDHAGVNPHVVAEVTVDQFDTGKNYVLAGNDEVIELFDGLPVTVEALREGSVFDAGPVMNLSGNYRDFARFETPLLGILSQASGFATAAARLVDRSTVPLLSFGSRHIHPTLAPLLERSAYIGGVDGYSNIAARNAVPEEPSGTMPHALMLSMRNCEKAWTAFHEAVPESIERIALVDTFTDEADEAIRAAETLGGALDGVRLDTTGSRRGNFEHIIREVRFKLDSIGRQDVEIYVSGGIDVDDIGELTEYVDGFGVGGAISGAPTVDFSLDIVEVDGEPTSKRGKLPGRKDREMNTLVEGGSRKLSIFSPDSARDIREREVHEYGI